MGPHNGSDKRRETSMNVASSFLIMILITIVFPVSVARSASVSSGFSPPVVLLIVNEALYPQISARLETFRGDLALEGFRTFMVNVTSQTSPPDIRATLQSYYSSFALKGAILIGDIKAAYFKSRTGDYSNSSGVKVWISLDAIDQYYMDLDGYWEHDDNPVFCDDPYKPPNVVECHEYPSCEAFKNEYIVTWGRENEWNYMTIQDKEQYKAEIWVARIMAHNLQIPGRGEAQIIDSFFEWDHLYRRGQKAVADRVYVLNAIDGGYNEQGMNYSGIIGQTVRMENVGRSAFLTCLSNPAGSKILYLTAHSWPKAHSLSDGDVTTDDLLRTEKNSIFYILNACSSCRWDQYVTTPWSPNYLGGLYVFDKSHDNGDYGLSAIGFTGVGGLNFLGYVTDYFNTVGEPIYGEAYLYWFNRLLDHIFGPWNFVFLGDPTIGPYSGIMVFSQIQTRCTIVISPNITRVGTPVATSGSVSPSVPGGNLTVSVSSDRCVWNCIASVPATLGEVRASYTPLEVGPVYFNIAYSGYIRRTSERKDFYNESSIQGNLVVGKAETRLSLNVSSTSVDINETLEISGRIAPLLSGITITMTITSEEGTRLEYVTTADGGFDLYYVPAKAGIYRVQASYEGDRTHEGSQSPVVTFSVERMRTALELAISPGRGRVDALTGSATTMLLSGRIVPAIRATIEIIIETPTGGANKTVTTLTTGGFSVSFSPPSPGEYSFRAIYRGSDVYAGSSSPPIVILVDRSYDTVLAICGIGAAVVSVIFLLVKMRKPRER